MYHRFIVVKYSSVTMFTGVAVGSGWQAQVAYVNLGSYYLVGVPLGIFFGWSLNFGLTVCGNSKI